ncbi:PREDICTED: transmembrane protein 202 [Elephantulus edwardii]|uniref:transmembrane protein 202 n=1 Tax=Elephantulus edwardii TaxID=28737 RepID=UPI0003F0E4C9|nr:PREDICTED: transmembrane protein 202 [Elephantulus edwardii]
MERKDHITLTFYSPQVPKIKGDRNYQRPTLPISQHASASMSSQRRQQHLEQIRTYTRLFCGTLCVFGLLILICMSPLNWVQFLVIKNGHVLYAGLWTTCKHELCWSHTPKPPHYLQYSRAFYLISDITILTGIGWFSRDYLLGRGTMSTKLDLKVALLIFTSAICLFLCLLLFLSQVNWHTKNVLESDLLWPYHLNWWSCLLYMFAGIISFINHKTSRQSTPTQNITVIPVEKSRLGFGPVTTTKDESVESEVPYQNEEETPNAGQ